MNTVKKGQHPQVESTLVEAEVKLFLRLINQSTRNEDAGRERHNSSHRRWMEVSEQIQDPAALSLVSLHMKVDGPQNRYGCCAG
jgi:hypothetical protein